MATLITYQDLKDARDNGTLTVNTEYEVSDYPTFHPIVKAVAVDELSEAGTTSDGKTILYSLDSDRPTQPQLFYGLVIFLSDGNNEAWFDWVNSLNFRNNTNVKIGPTYDSDGYRIPYQGAIIQCSNVVVYGNNTLNILGCQNAIVGSGNSGELNGCQYITVGDNNTDLSVQSVTGCQIGSDNSNVTVTADDTEIGNNNQDITISAPNGSVGTGNRVINVTGEEFEIENDCIRVNVGAKYTKVANTKYSDIKAPYNTVKDSNSVELVDSVGNTVDSSHLVYLRDVNNNDIYTSKYIQDTHPYTRPDGSTVQYNTPEPQPFVRIRPNNWQKPYRVATSMISGMSRQADNFGVVVDKTNETRVSNSIAQRYYLADGVWTLEDTQSQVAYVTMVMPKADSASVVVKGWGEYTVGTTVTLDFTYIKGGCWAEFVDQNNVHHSAPYTFIITKDTQVGVAVSNVPNDEIWYTSTDSQTITPYSPNNFGGATIQSNTYSGGKGVIKFSQALTVVGDKALYACTNLASISLPGTVTTIGFEALHQTALSSFVVPSSVTLIGDSILSGNPGLEAITVDSANTVYDSRDNCNGIVRTASDTLIMGCKNTVIPKSVTKVGGYAFNGCSSLTAITIPALVTNIEYFAFNSCPSLSSITFASTTTVPTLGAFVFTSLPYNGTVYGQPGLDYSSVMNALPSGWTLVQ